MYVALTREPALKLPTARAQCPTVWRTLAGFPYNRKDSLLSTFFRWCDTVVGMDRLKRQVGLNSMYYIPVQSQSRISTVFGAL